MKIITGSTGTEHVTSADDGSLYAVLFGTNQFVLPIGERLAYEIISSTKIKIKSGDIIVHGRYARIPHSTYDEVTIENGATGYNRNDLIVCRYEETDGIESMTLKVLKGTPSTGTATDPVVTTGNILNGDSVHEFPLYRVKLSGINLDSVEQLFSIWDAGSTHGHTSSQMPVIPMEKGGTGETTRKDAVASLCQIEPPDEDTVEAWAAVGDGWCTTDGIEFPFPGIGFAGPSGTLFNTGSGTSRLTQLFFGYIGGYYRGGWNVLIRTETSDKTMGDWYCILGQDIGAWQDIDSYAEKGTWEYLEVKVIGAKRIIRGRASSFAWSGTVGETIAKTRTDAPKSTHYFYAVCGGQRIARMAVNTSGYLVMDWCVNIKDGSNYTTAGWLEFYTEYYSD